MSVKILGEGKIAFEEVIKMIEKIAYFKVHSSERPLASSLLFICL